MEDEDKGGPPVLASWASNWDMQHLFGEHWFDFPENFNPIAQATIRGLYAFGEDSPRPKGDPFAQVQNNSALWEQKCQTRVLDAVNKTFGTNFNASNVVGSFFYNGAWNFNISGTNLDPGPFNKISEQGRYPLSGSTLGIGPTLHVPNSFHWDPYHVFTSSNIGGDRSVTFTAHIDSGNGNLFPIGTLAHFFRDVIKNGSRRHPCP